MSIIKCKICGVEVEVKPYDINRRTLCESVECHKEDRRLAMKAYRQTEAGKAMTKFLNLKYKVPDIDKVCQVCGEQFKTARKNRYICSKPECQAKGKYLRIKKYRASNIEKSRARDIVSKRINRESSMKREPCIACIDSIPGEAHHHNYSKPKDVIFLCWDSN